MKRTFILLFSCSLIVFIICFCFFLIDAIDNVNEAGHSYRERDEINEMITGVYETDVVFDSRIIPLDIVNHIVWETSTKSEVVGKVTHSYILNEIKLYNNEGIIIAKQSFRDRDYESSKIYIKFLKELAAVKKDKFIVNIIYNSENYYFNNQVNIDNRLNYTLEELKDNYNIEIIRAF